MGWTDNLLSYLKTGDCGRCPKCGGGNVVVQTHDGKIRTSLSFFCPDCHSGDHFDGTTKDTDCSQRTDKTLNLPTHVRLDLLRKGEKVLCKRCTYLSFAGKVSSQPLCIRGLNVSFCMKKAPCISLQSAFV